MNVSFKTMVLWVLLLSNLGCSAPDPAVKAYLEGVIDINNDINTSIEVSGSASYKRLEENRGKSAQLQSQALTADRDQWIQDRADLEAHKEKALALEVPESGEDLQSKFLVFIEAYDQRLQSRVQGAEAQLKDGQPPNPEARAKIAQENKALVEKYNAFDLALKQLGKSSGISVN